MEGTEGAPRPSPSLRPAAQMRSPSIGLALGSGGARGLAHIGVIQVLEVHNAPIDVVAGSSIGALVGGLYCSGKDGTALHRIASDTTLLKIIPLFDPSLRHGFMGGTKLERLIKRFVSGRRVEECQIRSPSSPPISADRERWSCSATGDLASVVRASISVPWVFRPVEIDGRLLADGGLSMPVPAEPARDVGADVVIAVDLDWERPLSDPSNERAPGVREIGNTSLALLRRHLAAQDARSADVVVRPRFGREVRWDGFLDPEELVLRGREAMVAEMAALEAAIETWRVRKHGNVPTSPVAIDP